MWPARARIPGRAIGAVAAACSCAAATQGCTFEDIDLTGRSCPCVASYVCDASRNLCVPAGQGGAATGGGGAGATGGGGAGATGGGGAGGGDTLLFSDEFDGDMSKWQVFGEPTWSVTAGEMRQTNPHAQLTLVYAPALDALTDYRAVTRMRQIQGSSGGAMELVFRVDVDVPQYYYCNYEPNDGGFLLMGTDLAQPAGYDVQTMWVDIGSIPSYDPMAWYTMVLEVQGMTMRCYLEEIAEATLTVGKPDLATYGSAGMKVWDMATAYDYFRVYSLTP
jgi:hypothetical protein